MKAGNVRRNGLIALLGSLLLGCALTVGVLLSTPTNPPSLDRPTEPDHIAVSEHPFSDPRTIELEITEIPPMTARARTSGTVTVSTCTPGGLLTSGKSDFAINGVRLTNMATSVPLWRSLSLGDEGDDVRALQAELTRLGASIEIDGVFGPDSLNAVRRVVPTMGNAMTFDPSQVLWMPLEEERILTCPFQIGQDVSVGDALVEIAGSGASVMMKSVPNDLLAGRRELLIGDLVIPLSESMGLDDTELRQQLLEAPAYKEVKEEGLTSRVPATIRLIAPVNVSSVPPGAVYGSGDALCIATGAIAHRVKIIGSELGQTFVQFEGEIPQGDVLLDPDPESYPCR